MRAYLAQRGGLTLGEIALYSLAVIIGITAIVAPESPAGRVLAGVAFTTMAVFGGYTTDPNMVQWAQIGGLTAVSIFASLALLVDYAERTDLMKPDDDDST